MTQSASPEPGPGDAEFFPSAEAWIEESGKVYLVGSRCGGCGKVAFPKRGICDQCDNTTRFEPVRLTNTGTLYSFSEVCVAPPVFKTPYVIGYVDLPEGVRVCAQIEHPAAELRVDEPVEVVLGTIRKSESGLPVVSYRFRKRGEAGDA